MQDNHEQGMQESPQKSLQGTPSMASGGQQSHAHEHPDVFFPRPFADPRLFPALTKVIDQALLAPQELRQRASAALHALQRDVALLDAMAEVARRAVYADTTSEVALLAWLNTLPPPPQERRDNLSAPCDGGLPLSTSAPKTMRMLPTYPCWLS